MAEITDNSVGIIFKINGQEYGACFTVPEDKRTKEYVVDNLWVHTDAAVRAMIHEGFISEP